MNLSKYFVLWLFSVVNIDTAAVAKNGTDVYTQNF